MGVRIGVKNHRFAAWQFGRRFALGAVTLMLVLLAGGPSGAAAGDPGNSWGQRNQSNGQRGQSAPARQGDQKSNQSKAPWWKDPVVIKEIRLTPDQANRIDAIWKRREQAMHGVATEHKKQKDELDRMMAERKVGPDVIGLQVDRVEAQRTTLNKSWTVMIYQFSLILTPEQNTALKAYIERTRRDRR